MQAYLQKLLSGHDNLTPDLLRLVAIFGVLVFLLLALMNWRTFDPITFGPGFGAVLVAAAGAFRLNDGPPPPPPPAVGAQP